MTHASLLYRLQAIDSEADARRSRVEEIDALLGQNEEVRKARQRLDAAEAQKRTVQAQVSVLELDIAGLEDKAKATEQRLYGGAVKNPKELQDMEQELASLRRRRETLEESLLENMLALEESQNQVSQATSELQAIEDRWAASQGNLTEEKREFEARLLDLEAARERVLAPVEGDVLALYERLRNELGGLAIAVIEDGVCSACGVAPTSSVIQKARHGQPDARCPTCGRILYVK